MENFLKTNPGKFQSMILGKKQSNRVKSKINSTVISESDTVELLAIITDNRLTLNNHINNLCHNASYKNKKYLTQDHAKPFPLQKKFLLLETGPVFPTLEVPPKRYYCIY